MKVLLLGDASNYHRALAAALRRKGCYVVLASAGSGWMDTDRDIDISRGSSKLSGAWLFAKLMAMTRTRLRGFDIVQIVSPIFTTLRPERLRRGEGKTEAQDNGTAGWCSGPPCLPLRGRCHLPTANDG